MAHTSLQALSMNTSINGSKSKFLSLPIERQHKRAATLLREWFEGKSEEYIRLCDWMELEVPEDREALSDRYHLHLKNAWLSIKEHNFLDFQTDSLCDEPFSPISIYLDNLRSAHNIGSILRTMEAFRFGHLVEMELNKKVIDASMGCSEIIPMTNEMPRPWVALEVSETSTPIHSFEFPEKFTLIVGNEEYGVSKEMLNQCDAIVEIPLIGGKNSLNVSNAFSIAAYGITHALSNSAIHPNHQ